MIAALTSGPGLVNDDQPMNLQYKTPTYNSQLFTAFIPLNKSNEEKSEKTFI